MDIIKNYYRELLIGLSLVLIIVLYGLYCYDKFYTKDAVNEVESPAIAVMPKEEESVKESQSMFVEIKGQVVNPGVYAVTDHNIIDDVINMAGGLMPNAYTKNINLSKKVSDEMVIIVYSIYEYSLISKPSIVYVEKPCKCETQDIGTCLDNGSSVIENGPSISNEDDNTSQKLININTATEEELDSLEGIGESKAKAIIKYRNENGNFKKIEEITNVSGISQNIFAKIKDSITV